MKFTINTARIQRILSVVSKGVGKKNTMPITEYLKITLDGGLSITATDMTNFITYFDDLVEGENGSVIVKAESLIKLVSKTTKEKMTFTLKEDHLEVKGNGTYKIELLEEGEFPSYEFDNEAAQTEIETATLKNIFNTNKSAIAHDMIMPCLTGYNLGARAITTDGIKMCINEVPVSDTDMLIPQNLADLLLTLTAKTVKIQKDENKILFKTNNITIFGTELDGISEYPDVTSILDLEHPSHVTVAKSSLLSAINRLSIFVNSFDNSGIRLQFTAEGLKIEDMKQNSQEVVEYEEESKLAEPIELVLNIDLLKDIVSVLHQKNVKIEVGEELPVKIVEDKVTQIISTMEVE